MRFTRPSGLPGGPKRWAEIARLQAGNGIKVGDAVEVVTGFGWTRAKVVAVYGNSYRVQVNGVQVTKDYPAEVRRLGAASARDHAQGQYRLGDRVQVNVGGRWISSRIVTEMGQDHQVEVPGNRTAWPRPATYARRPSPRRPHRHGLGRRRTIPRRR